MRNIVNKQKCTDLEPRSTNITKRLDRLLWSKWHTKTTVILATGWALDAIGTHFPPLSHQTQKKRNINHGAVTHFCSSRLWIVNIPSFNDHVSLDYWWYYLLGAGGVKI